MRRDIAARTIPARHVVDGSLLIPRAGIKPHLQAEEQLYVYVLLEANFACDRQENEDNAKKLFERERLILGRTKGLIALRSFINPSL